MEGTSSGEEVVVKARKPYTMTKQRERWTEEEHNRFLESLKLYGRAWQRIEEHIGTKTAVQIRSHAQKFFSKLEKEAITKGVPLGKALDIEIPPPRPKKKPCGPYPRKTGVGFVSPCVEQVDNKAVKSASSPSNDKQPLHKEINEPQDSPSPCISSVTQPSSASMKEKIVMDKSCLCTDLNKKLENSFHLAKPSEKQFPSMKDKKQEGDQNQETYTSSEMPSIHPPFPAFTPFTQFQTALLQNPAVNPAASFWLPVDVGSSNESSLKIRAEEIPVRHINPCPSMAAVATATVAAASAWWTTQGLLPLFPPLHPGFAFATVPTTVVPIMESDASERAHMACFTELKNSDKLISKRTDRSSGGSNIPSSSEVETDVRRSRSSGNINESWKEVSEEGRVAFQELFARDVLPQSFSPQIEENRCGKLKVCRTGFTPYKRCSVESDGIRASAGEETGSKRMHLEGEAST